MSAGLRWLSERLLALACWFDARRATLPEIEPLDARVAQQRVFELRNRAHCGYY